MEATVAGSRCIDWYRECEFQSCILLEYEEYERTWYDNSDSSEVRAITHLPTHPPTHPPFGQQ